MEIATNTLPMNWVLERLTYLSQQVKLLGSSDDSAEYILPRIISLIGRLQHTIQDPGSAVTTVGHTQLTSIERIVSIFKLSIPARVNAAASELKLSSPPPEVPVFLRTALTKLNGSDDYASMSARLGVDFLLLEARQVHLSTIPPNTSPLQIVPDVALNATIRCPIAQRDIVVTAHVDWVAGHAVGATTAVSFVALHAIRPDQFSGMYVQLLTGLAIARERRIQMHMKDRAVQGFVTDGVLYRFVYISDAGEVTQSRIYDLFLDGQMEVVYAFVCGMICSAGACKEEFSEEDERDDEMGEEHEGGEEEGESEEERESDRY